MGKPLISLDYICNANCQNGMHARMVGVCQEQALMTS